MARNRKYISSDAAEEKKDLRRQECIFLGTFMLMIVLLVSLYIRINLILSGGIAAILVISTVVLYIKYKAFYKLRDRGQRTWCVIVSMYSSLILTLGCAYYFMLDATLTEEYALVFLFGYMFFVYMVYRTLSPTMVVGNKRQRIHKS
ncbi:MAG: hypothetical protein LKF47_04150 [Megasphaera sp.]|jgi:hypothetical protein|nr:hypothetical protein [Megasphaera sp.]MCI1248040.1 hypothetical protein [Megasphaera sp.]